MQTDYHERRHRSDHSFAVRRSGTAPQNPTTFRIALISLLGGLTPSLSTPLPIN
jgi:hypothetical protein